jgi:hypothetical protein
LLHSVKNQLIVSLIEEQSREVFLKGKAQYDN